MVDLVGYGQRSSRARERLQHRLRSLLEQAMGDIGVDFGDTRHDAGTGDGMAVFLPATADPTRALPGLLTALTDRLGQDNEVYRDRIQLRMAIGAGLVGTGPMGFTGPLIVDLSRLTDSELIRKAVCEHPGSDLVVLVSGVLHDVLRSGYLPPSLAIADRVHVEVKEFAGPAWLWVSPPRADAFDPSCW